MAPRKKSSSKQPNVGAWLGGNKGYVLSGSNTDTSAKADAGGGQMEAVRGELGLGAYAAGIGAAGAIGAGVAAVRSGRAAQAVNKMTGQVVGLHGSPVKGLTEIKPIGPTGRAWAANPATGVQKATNIAREYSASNRGSLYVVKVSKKDLAAQSTDLAKSPTFGSSQPLKVVKEINRTFDFDPKETKAVRDALKKAGFKLPKRK
jgi:hypothetical protein